MWKTYRNRYLLSLKVIISLNSKFTTDRIFFFFSLDRKIFQALPVVKAIEKQKKDAFRLLC